MDWLNEPPEWHEAEGMLAVVTGERTDFWRETHYGFIRDDGHCRHGAAQRDFTAEVAFRGHYRALYDQAGLMLRLDERNWIKAGVEYVGGERRLSVVVTRDASDWSTTPYGGSADWLGVRLTRIGTAVHVHWAEGGGPAFRMLRLAFFPEGPAVVGPMCCSPQRAGFLAEFRGFALGPAGMPEE
jgi:regulation of enolase protein 1 (concanavalin A-like superfamily)